MNAVSDSFQTQDYQAPVQSAEDKYLADVRAANDPNLMDETDADLISVGYQTCQVLDSGYSVPEMVQYLLNENPSDEQIRYMSIIMGNAIEYFCPEYISQIQNF